MNIEKYISYIQNGGLDGAFSKLYSNCELARKRYIVNLNDYKAIFGDTETLQLFSAPGRTEIGGNHTDHQQGCVLAAALNVDVIGVAAERNDNIVQVKSSGHNMDTITLSELAPVNSEAGHAAALIRGMCARLYELGYNIGGFDAHTTSDVLGGSGMSSSAAFEVLIGTIISHLFNNGKIDPITIAKCGQYAENVYFEKPSGLMDQMACSVGGFVGIDFFEKDTPAVERVDFDFDSTAHSLCIVNTGGSHADLTYEYADVLNEMRSVANFFGKPVLSLVAAADIINNAAKLRHDFGDRAVLRAMHFVKDTERAVLEKKALQNGDFGEFLQHIRASGYSSFMYLQNIYSTSSVKEQGLSLALCLSENVLSGAGAYRVHGGGFGGTIQAFVPQGLLEEYRRVMDSTFGDNACQILNVRQYGGISLEKI